MRLGEPRPACPCSRRMSPSHPLLHASRTLQDRTRFWNFFRLEPCRAACGAVEYFVGAL